MLVQYNSLLTLMEASLCPLYRGINDLLKVQNSGEKRSGLTSGLEFRFETLPKFGNKNLWFCFMPVSMLFLVPEVSLLEKRKRAAEFEKSNSNNSKISTSQF